MKRSAVLIVAVAVTLLATSELTQHALLAQTTTGNDDGIPPVEIIGEGVISTGDDELGGGVTSDGNTLIFEKSAAPHYLYIMCESHLVGGKWNKPEILPFSGRYRDTDPVLAPDGKSILFASDRPVNGKDLHRWFIWRAQRSLSGWKQPQLLPGAVNSEGSQVFASVAANGNIYFASSRKTGQYDVFRSKFELGEYKQAEAARFSTDRASIRSRPRLLRMKVTSCSEASEDKGVMGARISSSASMTRAGTGARRSIWVHESIPVRGIIAQGFQVTGNALFHQRARISGQGSTSSLVVSVI
jgi:WD40-like Beta Propeller Repeat